VTACWNAGEDVDEPTDDSLIADGPVFVVILLVGVEVVRQPVLDVLRQQARRLSVDVALR
jgi:hypothetical protein